MLILIILLILIISLYILEKYLKLGITISITEKASQALITVRKNLSNNLSKVRNLKLKNKLKLKLTLTFNKIKYCISSLKKKFNKYLIKHQNITDEKKNNDINDNKNKKTIIFKASDKLRLSNVLNIFNKIKIPNVKVPKVNIPVKFNVPLLIEKKYLLGGITLGIIIGIIIFPLKANFINNDNKNISLKLLKEKEIQSLAKLPRLAILDDNKLKDKLEDTGWGKKLIITPFKTQKEFDKSTLFYKTQYRRLAEQLADDLNISLIVSESKGDEQDYDLMLVVKEE